MSTSTSGTSSTSGTGGGASGAATTAAVALWVVVGAGLVYGVSQTVIRATQLFTG